jgi:hypothetical protein
MLYIYLVFFFFFFFFFLSAHHHTKALACVLAALVVSVQADIELINSCLFEDTNPFISSGSDTKHTSYFLSTTAMYAVNVSKNGDMACRPYPIQFDYVDVFDIGIPFAPSSTRSFCPCDRTKPDLLLGRVGWSNDAIY